LYKKSMTRSPASAADLTLSDLHPTLFASFIQHFFLNRGPVLPPETSTGVECDFGWTPGWTFWMLAPLWVLFWALLGCFSDHFSMFWSIAAGTALEEGFGVVLGTR
jgi:hypothetical protein